MQQTNHFHQVLKYHYVNTLIKKKREKKQKKEKQARGSPSSWYFMQKEPQHLESSVIMNAWANAMALICQVTNS